MKIPGLRWVIALLLFTETLLAYLDLQEMSVLAPVLAKTIGMTNSQYAFVAQGFLVSYTVAFLLGGLVIDKLGVRWGLGASIFFWSVANALHALANTPNELAVCRFLLGLAYPAAFVAAARAVSEWYPAEERALGIWNLGERSHVRSHCGVPDGGLDDRPVDLACSVSGYRRPRRPLEPCLAAGLSPA